MMDYEKVTTRMVANSILHIHREYDGADTVTMKVCTDGFGVSSSTLNASFSDYMGRLFIRRN